MGLYRSQYFFMRLEKIEKAVYLTKNFDTVTLTQKSQFVATVTGSVGWEAISCGKPAVVFGQAWYSSLPGVFKYSHKLEIGNILSYEFSHEKLEHFYNILIRKTGVGIVDREYEAICEGYSNEDNTRNLKESLEKIIANIK